MIKTYMGIPGAEPVVTVTAGGDTRQLPGPHGWGRGPQALRSNTAKAILEDFFGDEPRAQRFFRRFMWRVFTNKPAEQPFALTSAEIATVLKEIAETEEATQAIRDAVDRERPPVADSGGIGVGGKIEFEEH